MKPVHIPFLLLVLAFAVVLCGCATPRAIPVVKTVTIEVPVAVKAAPPEALLACGKADPGFRFYSPGPDSNDVIIREQDQAAFQAWVNEKVRCIRAWQAWGDQ